MPQSTGTTIYDSSSVHADFPELVLKPDREDVRQAFRKACSIYGIDPDDFVNSVVEVSERVWDEYREAPLTEITHAIELMRDQVRTRMEGRSIVMIGGKVLPLNKPSEDDPDFAAYALMANRNAIHEMLLKERLGLLESLRSYILVHGRPVPPRLELTPDKKLPDDVLVDLQVVHRTLQENVPPKLYLIFRCLDETKDGYNAQEKIRQRFTRSGVDWPGSTPEQWKLWLENLFGPSTNQR